MDLANICQCFKILCQKFFENSKDLHDPDWNSLLCKQCRSNFGSCKKHSRLLTGNVRFSIRLYHQSVGVKSRFYNVPALNSLGIFRRRYEYCTGPSRYALTQPWITESIERSAIFLKNTKLVYDIFFPRNTCSYKFVALRWLIHMC